MDHHPNHQDHPRQSVSAPKPDSYERPAVVDLGSLRELTLSGGSAYSDLLNGAAGSGGS